MPKEWTRGERREMLRDKYRRTRDKLFGIVAVAAVFLGLLYLLSWGISAQIDPFLLVVLVVVIIILIPISIFFVDIIAHET